MRIAGIVLYNPDLGRLKDNIYTVFQQVDEVILVDNGSKNICDIVKLMEGFQAQTKDSETMFLHLIRNAENLGIAKALNQILGYAKAHNYEWVLSLDQDSIIQPRLLDDYDNFISNEKRSKRLTSQLGMLTAIYKDRNSELETETSGEYEEISGCITSGSYANIDALLSVGGYDEKMFIDYVDYDICATLRESGYSIVRINRIGLIHEVGRAQTVTLIGRKTNVHHESAFRKYYQVRNHLYYIKKHKSLVNKWEEYRRVLKLFILTILYESDRKQKLSAMVRGMIDSRKMIAANQKTGDSLE